MDNRLAASARLRQNQSAHAMTLRTKRERISAANHYRILYSYEKALPMPEKRVRKPADPNAPPLERDVLKAVLRYLSHHPKVAWCARINAGGTSFSDGHGGEHFVRFNYKRGISDIIGQMKDGRFIAVECKREGEELMDHQRDFLNEVLQNNGIAFVARSVDDAIAGIPS